MTIKWRVLLNLQDYIECKNNNWLLKGQRTCCIRIFTGCHVECSIVSDIYGSSDGQIFSVTYVVNDIQYAKIHSSLSLGYHYKFSCQYCIIFSMGVSVSECQNMLEDITKKSIIQWYNYYRDVCTTYLESNPVRFSSNCTLNVDETALGGKRKYNRGRIPQTETRWLFGIICSAHHKVHCEFIEDKKHETVIPIITRHVDHGATIYSDGAKVYQCLQNMHYNHNFVIHKKEYVNPVTGVHTNSIENFWGNLKMHLKSVRGSQSVMLDRHIDEYIYRYNRKNQGKIFNLILQDIAQYYPL